MSAVHLTLLDADSRRRAETTFAIAQHGIRIDPFESLSELSPNATNATAFLVFDGPGAIGEVLDWMGDINVWRPVIAYAHAPTIARVVTAINEGANDYLSWPIAMPKLQYAIDRLAESRNSLGELKARRRHASRRIDVLSQREKETLVLVAKGYSSRIIGECLNISPRTVEIHRANAVRKLRVDTTVEAIQTVFEAGLASETLFDPVSAARRNTGGPEYRDFRA